MLEKLQNTPKSKLIPPSPEKIDSGEYLAVKGLILLKINFEKYPGVWVRIPQENVPKIDTK